MKYFEMDIEGILVDIDGYFWIFYFLDIEGNIVEIRLKYFEMDIGDID